MEEALRKFKRDEVLEVILVLSNGDYLVQNEGNPAIQWVMNKDMFEMQYKEVFE